MREVGRHASYGDDEYGDAGDLLEAIRPPAWHARAACRSHPEVDFFASDRRGQAAALAVCAGCAVVGECGSWALDQGRWLQGVWGGLTAKERGRIRPHGPWSPYSSQLVARRRSPGHS